MRRCHAHQLVPADVGAPQKSTRFGVSLTMNRHCL
jgi:hypothetical protein